MADRSSARKVRGGSLTAASQERRRREVLARQKLARQELTLSRRLVRENVEDEERDMIDEEDTGMSHRQKRRAEREKIARRAAERWTAELCAPEWLLEVPESLNEWYCLPRPQGTRCVLTAHAGKTVARTGSGDILAEFDSKIPYKPGPSILESIFDGTIFWVLDCMVWAGHKLYECGAEFRFFWLRTKLSECNVSNIRPVEIFDCDNKGLRSAYSEAQLHYHRDGLLFYDKQGHYAPGRPTPLVRLWKDTHVSKYFSVPPKAQAPLLCVLRITQTENSEVVLSTLDDVAITPCQEQLPIGTLARFELREDDYSVHRTTNLIAKFVAVCSPKRAAPDSSTKLHFYFSHRAGRPLTFEALLLAGTGTTSSSAFSPSFDSTSRLDEAHLASSFLDDHHLSTPQLVDPALPACSSSGAVMMVL